MVALGRALMSNPSLMLCDELSLGLAPVIIKTIYDAMGAIIAAVTTSIPESPDSGRNWDYRYCWLRDAYFVVNALNQLGVTATMQHYLEYILNQTRARVRTHRYRQILIWMIVLSFGVGVLLAGYNYTQTRFYVGISQGHVAIFKGIKESLGPLKFSELYRVTQVEVKDLSTFEVEALKRTIPASDFAEAANVVQRLIRVGD